MHPAMSTKASNRTRSPGYQTRDVFVTDVELERFLADHRDEIEAKLRKARRSIARGRAKPLEPLARLLSEALRRAKPVR